MPDPSDGQENGPTPSLTAQRPIGGKLVYMVQDSGPKDVEQLYREILHLREFLTSQLQAVATGNDQRLAGMDKAIELTQNYPTDLDKRAAILEAGQRNLEITLKELIAATVTAGLALHDQKFATIDVRLADLDKLIGQTTAASKEAINAAFSAQKEAGALLATQTKEQINALQTLFNTTNNAASDKINALDRRMTTSEGRKQGGESTWMAIAGAIGAVVGIIGIIGAVIAFSARPAPQVVYAPAPIEAPVK